MSTEAYPVPASEDAEERSSLASRRGVAILLLLSLVQFMDILDASILNIALPSIKHDLGFSQQSLQWVVDGYILTYGGFLLLGARMADLLGRRLVLVTGLVVFAGSSLTGGLAQSSSLLVGRAASATPRWASGEPSPASAARRACSSAACSRRGPAGAGCCSSTFR
jgi:MFS family permease